MNDPTLEELGDYATAVKYLVEEILSSGNGKMLRALKTIMDKIEESKP